MSKRTRMAHLTMFALATSTTLALAPAAQAQLPYQPASVDPGAPTEAMVPGPDEGEPTAPPIPPNVEGAPLAAPGGGFCYAGPHPVDNRVAGGPAWDEAQGPHLHFYAPVDLRLFTLHDGCYYFVGDPTDFGYHGTTFQYYGAHPVLEAYGGGWCFMIGGHAHAWRPWSANFVVMGPWYYWHGPYDSYFWSYWPYYSFYYRSYYPHYYSGGRFYRHRDYHVAPPITRVPPAVARENWRGSPPPGAGSTLSTNPAWRGQGFGSWRGQPQAPAQAAPAAPAYPGRGNGWRAAPSGSPSGSVRATPVPSYRPAPAPAAAPARGAPASHGNGMRGGPWRR
jgi:hypothetical protein